MKKIVLLLVVAATGTLVLHGQSLAAPLTGASQVSASGSEACVTTTTGAVKCWGYAFAYGAGTATIGAWLTPVDVPSLATGVASVHSGASVTCARTIGGGAKCLGSALSGELGNGSPNGSTTAVDVSGLATGVASVAVGGHFACAVTTGGAAKCWGVNNFGVLGAGLPESQNSSVPLAVTGMSQDVAEIAPAWFHACARTTAGGVKCWGLGNLGQLGQGSTGNSNVPVDVSGLASGALAIAVGYNHSCAIVTGGMLKCWGAYNYDPALGTKSSLVAVTVPGVAGAVAVAAGSNYTCVLTGAGAVRCFGKNNVGQLGDGTRTDRPLPVEPVGLSAGVVAISGSGWGSSTCALLATGRVRCWGGNSSGQLGNGATSDSDVPAVVGDLTAQQVTFPAIANRATGSASFSATATASSGLAIAFVSVTPSICTVAGSVITLLTAGECQVRATQDGDDTYQVANTSRSFSVVDPAVVRLANISTRARATSAYGAGEGMVIGGFVVSGTVAKKVAIVAAGPSLTQAGVAGALLDPIMAVVRSSDQAQIATVNDWASVPGADVLQANGLGPSDTREAAVFLTLAPGAYTAMVGGPAGTTGVVTIAVYEMDNPDAKIINISTRASVLTGDDVVIAGFIIQGANPQTVAIVGTGPSLAAYGITNPLANPTITLVRSSDQAVIATNDNWQTDPNAAQLQAAGFAPSNPLEAAILVTLPPGAYTAILSGVGDGTGVGIIGVYDVQ